MNNNWWGTTTPSSIDELIYDQKDDYTLGQVNYEPFLTDFEPEAPVIDNIPPSNPEVINPAILCGIGYLCINWTNPEDEGFYQIKIYRATQSDILGDIIYKASIGSTQYCDTHDPYKSYY